MKIIFFGGSKFSKYYLDALKDAFGDVAGFTKLPTAEALQNLSPDVGVIAYFGSIVPEEILKIPKKGFINVHYSLLPRWRGAAPVQHAILAGDKEIGVTILLATKKVDAGAILIQKSIPILPDDTYLALEEKLIPLGRAMLISILPEYLAGGAPLKTQNEAEATYAKKINKSDGLINWSHDAAYIERMVRAYDPWPSAYTEIKNKKFKIKKAEVISSFGRPTSKLGEIFETEDGFPAVECGNGALKLLVVQPEGKLAMPGDAYLRGHRNIVK